jgi:hypothetical protein
MNILQYILIFVVTTFAGSYAIIFGGGSFLTLTALFLMGVDPKVAVATNQFGTVGQMITGSFIFSKHKTTNPKVIKWAAPAFIIGAIIGAFVLIQIDASLIKKLVSLSIIFFATLTIFKNPEDKSVEGVGKKKFAVGLILTLLTGIYSMVITTSSGTMMTFVLMYLFGLSFKTAVQNRQHIMVLGVALASILLLIKGYVDIYLMIPMFFGRALGGYLGAKFVLRTQGNLLRIIFSVIIILLALQTLLF